MWTRWCGICSWATLQRVREAPGHGLGMTAVYTHTRRTVRGNLLLRLVDRPAAGVAHGGSAKISAIESKYQVAIVSQSSIAIHKHFRVGGAFLTSQGPRGSR